jgi:hypothetical protein
MHVAYIEKATDLICLAAPFNGYCGAAVVDHCGLDINFSKSVFSP